MLQELSRRVNQNPNVDCRLGYADNLPVDGNSMDYVFANMCLHHVQSPERAICEMVRILKPKGKLIITDLDEHGFRFLKEEHHDQWLGFRQEQVKEWFS